MNQPEANAQIGEAVQPETPAKAEQYPTEWRFLFPNLADFNFNYWKLLDQARTTAIASLPDNCKESRVAIVGGGVAGLTAARELFRCGYQNIDIYEATERLGGRTYSVTSPDGLTMFEMGAMRLPFFWPQDEGGKPKGDGRRGSKSCVLDYYSGEFGISTQDFPNPGAGKFTTGIYINRGYGTTPPDEWRGEKPKLIRWEGGSPSDDVLKAISEKWNRFSEKFQKECRCYYPTSEWGVFWGDVVDEYDCHNFREFVRLKQVQYDPKRRGYFGGLGMTEQEAHIFAVVGMGEGGWGAFYDISCLYVLRTALFGFFDRLQLIQGKFSDDGSPLRFDETPEDSLGQPLAKPAFLGVQSLAECLFYEKASLFNGSRQSLYDAVKAARRTRKRMGGVHLFTQSGVRRVEKLQESGLIRLVSDKVTNIYNYVVVTAPPWSLQVEAGFENFDYDELPWETRQAMDSSHFITSCKVFYPLKERHWELYDIPQVIVTDTVIQGVYGMAVETDFSHGLPGVALISYTWEDDAAKLVADDDNILAQRCLDHLDHLLERCNEKRISPCIDTSAPTVHHWARSRSYRGCARLYRQLSKTHDKALLTYNETCSEHSGLYLAGEAYSVEGGWIEPALRSALHAVLHLIKNSGGEFANDFDFKYYPKYSITAHSRPPATCPSP
jgi:tryptophan 2-monooxygenase